MNYLKKNKPLIYNQCKTSLGYLNNKKNFAMSEGKPEMTYVQLISEALSNAPGGRLKKEEIYEAISSKHTYYKSENSKGKGPNWQRKINLCYTISAKLVLKAILKLNIGITRKTLPCLKENQK